MKNNPSVSREAGREENPKISTLQSTKRITKLNSKTPRTPTVTSTTLKESFITLISEFTKDSSNTIQSSRDTSSKAEENSYTPMETPYKASLRKET